MDGRVRTKTRWGLYVLLPFGARRCSCCTLSSTTNHSLLCRPRYHGGARRPAPTHACRSSGRWPCSPVLAPHRFTRECARGFTLPARRLTASRALW